MEYSVVVNSPDLNFYFVYFVIYVLSLQVNRGMVDIIASLAKKPEGETSGESNDNDDGSVHDSTDDGVAEPSKPADTSESVLEEIKDNDLNQQPKRRKEEGRSEA